MLLTSMMVRPFFYPHPCVSVLFNEELLDNPFTGILGLNKSTKWLDANIEYLSTQKDNKVVVNLNEE